MPDPLPEDRLDFAVIDRLLGGPERLPAHEVADRLGPLKVEAWAPARRISYQLVRRWRKRGLTVVEADRVATALGWSPTLLWPTWADLADAEWEALEATG